MTAAAQIIEALDPVVALQHEFAQTLLVTLEKERDALISIDSESIETIGKRKLEQLAELEALEIKRQTLAKTHEVVLSDWVTDNPDSTLANQWKELLQLLDRCRFLNESNGALVALQRQHVQQALGFIYGQTQDGGVYDADGMQPNHTRTTTIATA